MGRFNLLLPNGIEFADVSRPNPLRFSDQRLDQRLNLPQAQAGNDQPGSDQVEAAIRDANGIFRVWQRDRTPFGSLDDSGTMDYELISVDPAYLIGAPIRPGSFTWRPGREIAEFGCTVWE